MWKSAPSGPATSLAKNVPTDCAGDPPDDLADEVALRERVVAGRRPRLPPRRLRGEQRRCTSPSRTGPRRRSALPSPTARRCGPSGGGPRRSPCRWPRTPASSCATGASRSSSPRSARISAQSAVIVLVVDQTLMIVSRSHGVVRASSVNPPQMSTTSSPSRTTATDAPTSSPWSKFARTPSRPCRTADRTCR